MLEGLNMSKYVIITDSACDLSKEYRQIHNIEYAKMMLNWTDENNVSHEQFADLDWEILSLKEFYDIERRGIRIFTSQITQKHYLDLFTPHLEKGEDILYLAVSSGLSSSIKTCYSAIEELKAKYPNNRVVVVDTLRAGMAQGLIVMRAVELKDEGKSLDDVVKIIEQEKLSYKEVGIPESLIYLKRAGRVKAAAAFFGGMVSLKPILVFDENGCNYACDKAIGKKAAFRRMAEMIRDDIVDANNQEIYLMHADCKEEDIQNFKDAISAQVTVKNIRVEPLGPIIGASSGPGTIIVNYRGK